MRIGPGRGVVSSSERTAGPGDGRGWARLRRLRLQEQLPQLAELAERYEDRRPDLADLCLVRMSEIYPKHSVVTVDRKDLRVYRRNKREVIPLVCPPGA
jgi:hypothetical protein